MSSRDYLAALEDEDPREDEVVGEPEDEPAAPRANVTLDLREIRGRPDDYGDDALDVAESAARKGPSGMTGPMPSLEQVANRQALDTVRDALHEAGREVAETDVGRAVASAPRAIREAGRMLPDLPEGTPEAVRRVYEPARAVAPELTAEWLESGTAPATAFTHGVTLNLADDIGGALRASALGEDFDEARGELREEANRAEAEHPLAYNLGHAAGSTALAMAIPSVGPVGRGFIPALGRVASEGAVNAGLGFVEGAAGYEGDDLNEGLDEAMSRATTSAAWGAAGRGVGELAGGAASAARRFGDRADDLRVGATLGAGSNPLSVREYRELAAMPGGIPAAAERIRRLGLGTVAGTAADTAENAERVIGRLETDLADYYRALEEANPEGVPVARFVEALDEPLADTATRPWRTRHAGRITDRMDDLRNAAAARGSDMMPIREAPTPERDLGGVLGTLRDARRGLDHVAASEGAIPAGVDLDVYRALRRELDAIADETVGDVDRFRGLRNDLATANIVNDAARPAMWRNASSGPVSLRGLMAGLAMGRGSPLETAAATLAAGSAFRRSSALNATLAESVREILRVAPERLGPYAGVFANAITRGGDDLLEAIVARSVESDPELGTLLSSPEMSDEEVNAALDEFFSAPGGEPEMTDEEVNAALDDFFSTEN